MKMIEKEMKYASPQTEVITLSTEGVLCASEGKNGFHMEPMDVIEGTDNPWGWEE